MNKIILKRGIAYIIDILIVSIIISVFSTFDFLNINLDKYSDYQEKINEVMVSYNDKEISEEEYNQQIISLSYEMNRTGVNYNVLGISVLILYFVVFQYFMKGQTVGKKLMKIKVTSDNGGKVSIFSYFIRSLIVNNLFATILSVVFVLILKENIYYYVNMGFNNIGTVLMYAAIIMMFWRFDGRGLHDILAKTSVVDVNLEEKKDTHVIEAVYDEKEI